MDRHVCQGLIFPPPGSTLVALPKSEIGAPPGMYPVTPAVAGAPLVTLADGCAAGWLNEAIAFASADALSAAE